MRSIKKARPKAHQATFIVHSEPRAVNKYDLDYMQEEDYEDCYELDLWRDVSNELEDIFGYSVG